MTTRELMIGNYVMAINNYEDIFYVNCIYGYRDLNITSGIYKNYDTTIRDIKPIQLTKEWLLKFGFENKPDIDNATYYTTVFEKDDISLLFFMGDFDDCSINGDLDIDLSYVHTLQNFWMCLKKQELTIKNK